MNILLVTNNLYPTGGDWTYVDNVAKLYKQHGHTVYFFGQKNEKNLDHSLDKYYVSPVNTKEKNKIKLAYKVLRRSIYSREAESLMRAFLRDYKVDIVQLNSFNIGLTPSIINPIKEANIPIVWRVIEYKSLCPNIYLMRNGKVCEDCKGGRFYNCIRHRCKNNSLIDSVAVALESYFYKYRKEYSLVDVRSYQNYFTRDLFSRFGVDNSNSVVEINPFDAKDITPCYEVGDYVLYFGRLVRPKGLLTIIEAAKQLPEIIFKIVGTGDLEDTLKQRIEAEGIKNVHMLGEVWGKELDGIIKKSSFVISASEWYEPSSYVALQTFANGKPVIASKQGGVPEIVKDGYSGLIFETGNADSLAETIKRLYNDKAYIEELGRNARFEVETEYSPEGYYARTISLFEKLLKTPKH